MVPASGIANYSLPAIANPLVMIASDGGIRNGVGHPSWSRELCARDGQVRSGGESALLDGRASQVIPDARSLWNRQKGRLKIGADADSSVFDPMRVIDTGMYENPAQYSEGFQYVMVGGTFVVRDGKLREDVVPGQTIRAQ